LALKSSFVVGIMPRSSAAERSLLIFLCDSDCLFQDYQRSYLERRDKIAGISQRLQCFSGPFGKSTRIIRYLIRGQANNDKELSS
jgi:hypothetical protein